MDGAATLADFLDHQGEILADATHALWKRMAGWTRDQMIDAGAMMYAAVAKDMFHVAGIRDPEDWFTIDQRSSRNLACRGAGVTRAEIDALRAREARSAPESEG